MIHTNMGKLTENRDKDIHECRPQSDNRYQNFTLYMFNADTHFIRSQNVLA